MSYPHSKTFLSSNTFTTLADTTAALDGSMTFIRSGDRVIDAALRNVPLPEGFMRRLGQLAGSLSEGVSDSIDYLGC
jgi:hypothetical protein